MELVKSYTSNIITIGKAIAFITAKQFSESMYFERIVLFESFRSKVLFKSFATIKVNISEWENIRVSELNKETNLLVDYIKAEALKIVLADIYTLAQKVSLRNDLIGFEIEPTILNDNISYLKQGYFDSLQWLYRKTQNKTLKGLLESTNNIGIKGSKESILYL
jgi:hypothetical protein